MTGDPRDAGSSRPSLAAYRCTLVEPNAVRPRRATRSAITAARIVVSVVMLTILIARIPTEDLGDLWPTFDLATIAWLAGAIAATTAAFLVASARWREVVLTLGVTHSATRLLHHYMAGQFVGNFLPTTIGGDVLRVARLGREAHDRPRAFASVIIERLTGWFVLPFLTLVALILDPSLLSERSGRIAALVAAFTLMILCGIVYLAEHPKIGGRVVGDTGIRQSLGAVHTGLSIYRREPAAAIRLLAVGALYQLLLVLAVGLTAAAIGIRPGVLAWLAFAPMVLVIQVLPVAIGGLGVREGALVVFLAGYGVSDASAVSLGLALYALNLLVSLAGAPSFVLGAPRDDHAETRGHRGQRSVPA